MTETPTTPPETGDETETATGPEAPKPTGSGRFAVYDTTLLRYVGGVSDKRPSKADANKLVHTRDGYRIDEV
jgi:hypothetical protein